MNQQGKKFQSLFVGRMVKYSTLYNIANIKFNTKTIYDNVMNESL